MTDYFKQKTKIEELQAALDFAKRTLERNPATPFIAYAQHYFTNWLHSEVTADMLASALRDRDYPMSEAEIRKVFESSGLDYNDSNIADSHPDNAEALNEWIAEELRNNA